MKKLKVLSVGISFFEGCELYLQDCKQRNLREGTINHYKQSITQFKKYFDLDLPVNHFTEQTYKNFVEQLRGRLSNDISINSYLRDYITIIHFLQNTGYIEAYKMQSIKTDKKPIKTYSDDEIEVLLRKPNLKKCNFTEYQCWVISCLLFTTGIRQHSLMELHIKDIDFCNKYLNVGVTKSRNTLLIPLNDTMVNILYEFLKHRQHNSKEDWLFCNAFGKKLKKGTCYHFLYYYNKRRGIETTGIHRWRHTFAKQWILNGGNVVTLSRLMGHSNLSITQNYINLLVSDLSKSVEEINLLNRFTKQKTIKMKGE